MPSPMMIGYGPGAAASGRGLRWPVPGGRCWHVQLADGPPCEPQWPVKSFASAAFAQSPQITGFSCRQSSWHVSDAGNSSARKIVCAIIL